MIELPADPKRILIVKPSALGDIVHALPVLSLLRRRWPSAEISWLVVPAFAQLLEGHPQVDRVWQFERGRRGAAWRDLNVARKLRSLKKQLREHRFDLVIDLQGLFRSGWLAAQTRAPVRIGFAYAREMAAIFYTHRVASRGAERHAIERYLDVAEELGCGRSPVEFEFGIDDDTRQAVRALAGKTPYCLLFPGTNWPTKRWPAERFAGLAGQIEQSHGLRCIFAGGRSEADLAPPGERFLNLAGQTTIKQLVALIESASLVVSNDSGPMHIAAALSRPLVSLFGPTNPVRTGPYQRMETVVRLEIACSPCYSRSCSHHSCMQWLKESDVMHEIARQMDGK